MKTSQGNKKQIPAMIVAALCAATIIGCNSNNEQISSDYQKLSPAEAKKRSDNLIRLRGGKPSTATAPAGQGTPQ